MSHFNFRLLTLLAATCASSATALVWQNQSVRTPISDMTSATQSPIKPSATLHLISWQATPMEAPTHSLPTPFPGVFRGDWGEKPVYAHNDRVNDQGAVYLSLVNDNQNQPPALSPQYWRLLQPARPHDETACHFPHSGQDLRDCDFSSESSLKDLDVSGAQLAHSRLQGELGSADLSHADLSGATVIGSLVISPETRLEHANLSGLQAGGNNPVFAEAAQLTGINLSHANLYGAKMNAARLEGAQLTEATLTGADLSATQLQHSDLRKADLTYANLTAATLSGATLNQADLTQANLRDTDFSAANLNAANLAGADLTGSNLAGASLHGTDLTAAQGLETVLIDRQTDFTLAICPDGHTVDGTQIKTCLGHGF